MRTRGRAAANRVAIALVSSVEALSAMVIRQLKGKSRERNACRRSMLGVSVADSLKTGTTRSSTGEAVAPDALGDARDDRGVPAPLRAHRRQFARRTWTPASAFPGSFLVVVSKREHHPDARAVARRRLERHSTVVGLHDGFHDR